MSHYRRCYVPGGSYFFTVVTERRAPILGDDLARDLLRLAFRDCMQRWPPFRVDAMVMLRDHLHAIWTLPPDDADYSTRWGAIKKHFTQSWLELGGPEKPRSVSRVGRRWRGVWQPCRVRTAHLNLSNRTVTTMGCIAQFGCTLTPLGWMVGRRKRCAVRTLHWVWRPLDIGEWNHVALSALLCSGRFLLLYRGDGTAGAVLGDDLARDLLRLAFRDCMQRWPPFRVDAMVMLRDHLHAIWTLPSDDADYSSRWGAIKKHFTQSWLELGGPEKPRSVSRVGRRRRGVWQRSFWEHTLRDEMDYARHFDYIHYNPVKHGLVDAPCQWPYSTFHHWVKQGVYEQNWGRCADGALAFSDLADTVGE